MPPRVRRKLIEVALPLDAINAAAAREKSIRPGHPSTLHLWWGLTALADALAGLQPPPGALGAWMRHRQRRVRERHRHGAPSTAPPPDDRTSGYDAP